MKWDDVVQTWADHHPLVVVVKLTAVGQRSVSTETIQYPVGSPGTALWCSCSDQPHGDIDSWTTEFSQEHFLAALRDRMGA